VITRALSGPIGRMECLCSRHRRDSQGAAAQHCAQAAGGRVGIEVRCRAGMGPQRLTAVLEIRAGVPTLWPYERMATQIDSC